MGTSFSSSSFNPNPTPMGHGGHFTETQYRNQLRSANQHYDNAKAHANYGGNGVGYCNRQNALGD